jgi:hypothetical protein
MGDGKVECSREVPQFDVRASGPIGDVEIMDYPTSPR